MGKFATSVWESLKRSRANKGELSFRKMNWRKVCPLLNKSLKIKRFSLAVSVIELRTAEWKWLNGRGGSGRRGLRNNWTGFWQEQHSSLPWVVSDFRSRTKRKEMKLEENCNIVTIGKRLCVELAWTSFPLGKVFLDILRTHCPFLTWGVIPIKTYYWRDASGYAWYCPKLFVSTLLPKVYYYPYYSGEESGYWKLSDCLR